MEIVGTLNLVLLLASVGVRVVAFADALIRPTAAFPAAGKLTKIAWCAILGIAVLIGLNSLRSPSSVIGLFNIAGLIAGIVYLVDVRPAVKELGRPGQNQGPYGTW